MAKEHHFVYSPSAVIEVANLSHVVIDAAKIKVLTMSGSVPKADPFLITVDLPTYKPRNLFPKTKNKDDIESSLLVGAIVYDTTALSLVTWATKLTIGSPVNHPRRKHKLERNVQHQTFQFTTTLTAAGFTTVSTGTVVIVIYSLHDFYDSDVFNSKTILQEKLVVVE